MASNKSKKAIVIDTLVPARPPVVETPRVVEEVHPATVEAPKAVSHPYVPKFRIVETAHVSLWGQVVLLRKGEIVDQGGYGADGIKRMIDGGAKLEEVK